MRLPRLPVRLFARGALLAALLVPALAQGEKPPFAEVHGQAVKKLIVDLGTLAAWAGDKELFAERDRAWRAVLELDPENAGARKALRYSKRSDGTWVEPAPRDIKNFNTKALQELPAHRRAAVEPYSKTMLAALDEYACDEATRGLVCKEILIVDPDDPATHALLGEVKSGDAWVLAETVVARERRVELKALVQRALDANAKLAPTEVNALEKSMNVAFGNHVQTAHVRVLSSGEKAEAETAARACEATAELLRFAFGLEKEHAPGYTVYLLANGGEQDLVLDKLPGIDAAYRQALRGYVGTKIPGHPTVVYWDRDPKKRLDGAVRQTIGDFLGRGFGIDLSVGWAWEGIGHYLTRELVGTRLTWFSAPDKPGQADALKGRLVKSDTNWINEAYELLQKPDHPSFAAALDREVAAMSAADVLYGYALAAYLIEARPKDGPLLLQRVGQGVGDGREKTTAALQAALRLDANALERRLGRWLGERR